MRKRTKWELLLFGMLGCAPGGASAETPSNLLELASVVGRTSSFDGDLREQVAYLIDANADTVAVFESDDGEPVDLLFAFEGGTVASDSFSLVLSDGSRAPAPARIDLLASTSSASSGFTSLRTELIDSLKLEQKARFGSTATEWLLVRLYPAGGATHVALADFSVGGKEGFPETNYAFGQTPADALEIVGAMQGIGAADLSLTLEEAEIFARAAKGNLSNSDFVEVALLASGVADEVARSDYLARVDALTAKARTVLDDDASAAEAGSQLLAFLHEHALQGGYREQQTNLSVVLDEGVFNCVSSAVLYNAVASDLGLDVRAIEVPDHAFSIVYDGLNHMDVETTTAQGFNPQRDKVAEFESLTGFRYIPESNKSKRREIDAAGLAALIYYNHGVAHLKEGRYQEALFANFRAMSLDPEFASAATNALAALGRWSTSLADEGNWQDATEVASVGARLAPDDRGLSSTRKAIWQRWAFSEADAGRHEAALDILTRAAVEVDRKTFDGMRSAILIRPAETLIERGNWQGALDVTSAASEILDPGALEDLREWRSGVFQRWAQVELDNDQFETAFGILEAGLATYPSERSLERAARYLAQEWARAEGFPDGLSALQSVIGALPQVAGLDEVAEAFVRRHVRAGLAIVELEAALEDVRQSTHVIGPDRTEDLTAFVYEAYGHDRIDAKDWEKAAEIYSEGRQAVPQDKILSRNARYVAQEWQREASAAGGVAALDEVQRRLRGLFPEFAVDPGWGEAEIVRQVNSALRTGDFTSAEATLSSAQLLMRPENYRKLRIVIIDHQARAAMDAAEWAAAANIYHDGRVQLGDTKLFSRNVVYIAQEWARAEASANGAIGVAGAMEDLNALFPQDRKVAGMGVSTLERMIAKHIEVGEFEAAEEIVRQARRVLSQNEAGELLVTLYTRAGSKAIEEARWDAALAAYADGLAVAPDSRDLSRNVPYVFQEWSRTALQEGGAPFLVAETARMKEILPGTKSLPDVLESVLGRAVSEKVDDADPEGALTLINEVAAALPDEVTAELKVIAYDLWAKTKLDAEAWQEAIEIYDMGLLDVPESRRLMNNRRYAESKL